MNMHGGTNDRELAFPSLEARCKVGKAGLQNSRFLGHRERVAIKTGNKIPRCISLSV
jgi:hypothetical protein